VSTAQRELSRYCSNFISAFSLMAWGRMRQSLEDLGGSEVGDPVDFVTDETWSTRTTFASPPNVTNFVTEETGEDLHRVFAEQGRVTLRETRGSRKAAPGRLHDAVPARAVQVDEVPPMSQLRVGQALGAVLDG
jgi:hypothetical protein